MWHADKNIHVAYLKIKRRRVFLCYALCYEYTSKSPEIRILLVANDFTRADVYLNYRLFVMVFFALWGFAALEIAYVLAYRVVKNFAWLENVDNVVSVCIRMGDVEVCVFQLRSCSGGIVLWVWFSFVKRFSKGGYIRLRFPYHAKLTYEYFRNQTWFRFSSLNQSGERLWIRQKLIFTKNSINLQTCQKRFSYKKYFLFNFQ